MTFHPLRSWDDQNRFRRAAIRARGLAEWTLSKTVGTVGRATA